MAATFKLKRFANVGLLRKIDFTLLLQLLAPFSSFFEGRHEFQWTTNQEEFSFEKLSKVMLTLDSGTPEELLRSLYFVDCFADDLYFDPLLEIAQAKNLSSISDDITPADLALTLWLHCPDAVEQFHADVHRHDRKGRAKRFESFFSTSAEPLPLAIPSSDTIENMQNEIGFWAYTHKRGKGVRIFVTPENGAVWIMIRHGQPMKRENTIEADGGDGLAFYRPEKFDTMIYYPETGELAVCAKTKGEQTAYSACLGKHCFGSEKYFDLRGASKYTLEPLTKQGRSSLYCTDIPGIRSITLREVLINHGEDSERNIEIRRCDDVFDAMELERRPLTGKMFQGRVVKAKFEVFFEDNRVRTMTIELPNIAHYDRESDHELLNLWLMRRRFIVRETFEERVSHETYREPVLVHA